ncbi:hypothetical protein H0H87_004451 [Tephrocybe sp. NHM501043]|nr:hypothetical protein H0H87_004451 [Tephrocybe sp. NHM501043]
MPKVLVANRGEIAIRVLRAATELGWTTVATYTDKDESHATFADEVVKLDNVTDFLDVKKIVAIAQRLDCTHLHPASVVFIGPSIDTLRIASDKLLSRELATSVAVKVAPGRRVSSVDDVHAFARVYGLPLMIKALDGGGGRGIRIVQKSDDIEEAFNRCLGESPSRQIFVEQALTGPSWKHVEVQIVGDGTGAVTHLWERECSVQRRFQKIIEVAPSRLPSSVIKPLLEASMKVARQLKYHGIGTFEYLVNARTLDWVFLEINPRVQVEHTVTEDITGIDLVRTQLLLFSSSSTLASLSLQGFPSSPNGHAIQLRLTAEDPMRSFRLSLGTLNPSDIIWPSGPGVRVDTWLSDGPFSSNGSPTWTVSPEFDSLLAKVIVHGNSFEEATQRAKRALRELRVGSLSSTNRDLLAGVVNHPDWLSDNVDTLWLERNLDVVLERGKYASSRPSRVLQSSTSSAFSPTQTTLQPGTLFHLTLAPSNDTTTSLSIKHNLTLSSISENAFPSRLSGILQTSLSGIPLQFTLSQSMSAAIESSAFELANSSDEAHIASPLTGKVVELHPALLAKNWGAATDRFIRKGETIMIISVMKMESSVTAQHDGYVERVGKGIRTGIVIGEGILVCILSSSSVGSKL